MGFREHNRRGSYNAARGDSERFSGRGNGGFRGKPSFGGRRSFGGGEGGQREMFDATCSKCGKPCRVPFRPTGTKPVLCSDCFRQSEGGFRNNDGPSQSFQKVAAAPGITGEQFKQLNAKLDKILEALEGLEIVADDEVEDDEDLDDEDEE